MKSRPTFSTMVEHDLGSEITIVATFDPATIREVLNLGFQKSRNEMLSAMTRDVEQNPSGAYLRSGQFEHCGSEPSTLIGCGVAWVKGNFYHRLILPDFPPELHQVVKANLLEITVDHMQKLVRSIAPTAQFTELTEFESE